MPIALHGRAGKSRTAVEPLGPPVMVPLNELLPADSPRLAGESETHARVLAESESGLPPILVHRATMRVIDGMHRLRAAALRGEDHIAVRFFDGPLDQVFVLAVESNIRHGLPLSRADRENAAARILVEHPAWSDRAIATAAGLSAKAVAAIRRRVDDGSLQCAQRIGRDGRIRPLNGAAGRRSASAFIAANPQASLRTIARDAGISLGTARDVRERIRLGLDPVPERQRRKPATIEAQRQPRPMISPARLRQILTQLASDPTLRFTESGRALLRWCHARVQEVEARDRLIEQAPTNSWYALIEFAQCYSDGMAAMADRMRTRLDEAS
jgi:ParB-like chromosome segregation protein Spo0J